MGKYEKMWYEICNLKLWDKVILNNSTWISYSKWIMKDKNYYKTSIEFCNYNYELLNKIKNELIKQLKTIGWEVYKTSKEKNSTLFISQKIFIKKKYRGGINETNTKYFKTIH